MSVFLGFLEATERRDITSADTASCESLVSTECMTAGSYRPTVDQMTLLFSAFPLSFFLSSPPPQLPSLFLSHYSGPGRDDLGPEGRAFWELTHALP